MMTSFSTAKTRLHNSVKPRMDRLHTFIGSSRDKCPYCFPGLIFIVACMGYAYLLMFPLLVLIGIQNIYDALSGGKETIDWIYVAIWSAVVIVMGFVTYRWTQIKFAPPVGLTLVEDKAPELFRAVRQLQDHFKRPKIHRIVITGNYELDIVKTPKWPLPIWSVNTMVIGLPLLQCFSSEQFECKVASRLGQFFNRESMLTNWLNQLREIWCQYRIACSNQKKAGLEFLKWFFVLYAPFYSAVSAFVARRGEMNADTSAMQLYNDAIVQDMLTADTVYRWYLQNRYWPAVNKIAAVKPKMMPTPHSRMAQAAHDNLKGEKLASSVKEVLAHESDWKEPYASLHHRLENIGHETPHMKEHEGETAAMHYLGASVNGVINLLDKLWLKTFLEKNKQDTQSLKTKSPGFFTNLL